MALSDTQKEYIDHALQFAFELPTDADLLKEKIKEIKNAFTTPLDADHELFLLREYALNPTQYLQGLENRGPAVTIGEIRDYMIARITTMLEEAATAVDLSFKSLDWKFDAIRRTLPKEDESLIYASKKTAVDGGTNPWDLRELKGKVYTRHIRAELEDILDPDTNLPIFQVNRAYLDITVHGVPLEEPPKKSYALDDIPNFVDILAEETYRERLHEQTEQKAKAMKFAAAVVFEYLLKLKLIKRENRKTILNSRPVMQVMTDQYYFDLICEKTLSCASLFRLSKEAADNLTEPFIIDLIQNDVMSIKQAMALSRAEGQMAIHPVYYSLLLQHKMTLEDLKQIKETVTERFNVDLLFNEIELTEEEVPMHVKPLLSETFHFLMQPDVSNLIKLERITLSQAISIPPHLRCLLTTPLYQDFFKKNSVDWEMFSLISASQVPLLLDEKFSKLVTEGLVTITDVRSIASKNISFLLQHSVLMDGLRHNLIDMQQFSDESNSLLDLYLHLYTTRLYCLYLDEPITLNGIQDTVPLYQQDLISSASECATDIEAMRHYILELTLYLIKRDLLDRIMTANNNDKKFYAKIVDAIIEGETEEKTDWDNKLAFIIDLAIETATNINKKARVESYTKEKPISATDGLLFSNKRKRKENTDSPHEPHLKRKKSKGIESSPAIVTFCDNIVGLAAMCTSKTPSHLLKFHC